MFEMIALAAFAGLEGEIRTAVTGSPILPGVVAFLDCRVEHAFVAGDHTIFTGLVQASGVARPEEAPLLYFHGAYRALGDKL